MTHYAPLDLDTFMDTKPMIDQELQELAGHLDLVQAIAIDSEQRARGTPRHARCVEICSQVSDLKTTLDAIIDNYHS